jgi:ADP-heptose:LPS heptosyltransferase
MKTLIIKLDATGDVVRTTPLLHRLAGQMTWLTAAKNMALFERLGNLQCFSWEQRDLMSDLAYDFVINLEDRLDVAQFAQSIRFKQLFGAYVDRRNALSYTDDSRPWFDLSIISRHGKAQADRVKFENRRTYQELIFDGLGFQFGGEPYLLPEPVETGLSGDVAIAAEAGPVWPMKKWAYYDDLKKELESAGLKVNMLQNRPTLLEHLADVQGHRCLVSGDSLPMHLALGSGIRCVSIFTCTSPWEIHGYGLQEKIVSPVLEKFFYKRGYDRNATTAISVENVRDATIAQLDVLAVSAD